MQTTEATAFHAARFDDFTEVDRFAEFTEFTEFADEHPVGRISLGASGGLGLRSRILGAADGIGDCTGDLPWTTMTWS
ncbi:hypothetical protein ACGF8B_20695 [Streptomyces sp. NPDC047917]|uniref:hypothetical protein n=1 Tax=Streptomyces sp. NPDC047917 TaxID=3365491 RepID=UPI003720C910